MDTIEIIGLIGGIFVVAAFLFTKERPIRIVSSFAAVIFIIYGILAGAWSIWILNSVLLVIQTVRLVRLHIEDKRSKNP
ncbi:MAG: YgjV family protein [Oscillospiraceae bacterium]|nr:YgjV family protein [Oscillospiraceae bacterium]